MKYDELRLYAGDEFGIELDDKSMLESVDFETMTAEIKNDDNEVMTFIVLEEKCNIKAYVEKVLGIDCDDCYEFDELEYEVGEQ